MKISQAVSAKARLALLMGASMFAAAPAHAVTLNDGSIRGDFLGRFTHTAGAEIVAYDAASENLWVVGVSVIDVINISNPASPSLVTTITNAQLGGGGVNSVSIKNGIVAAAVQDANTQANGKVFFFNTAGVLQNTVTVGALPDMLTFTPDGTKVIVANEGEPNSYGQGNSVDPEGSISIIDVSGGVGSATVTTAGFGSFNGQAAALKAAGVRIFGPNAAVAQDLEPEYIAISADSSTAYVTLQEANALATVNLATGTVTSIKSFGLKDHSLPGNGLDPSDRDVPGASNNGIINIQNHPVFGMYQPDAIASFQVNGQTFLLTANEGDARDYTGFAEEVRVGAVDLDNTLFPNEATLKDNDVLGRLTITNQNGQLDADAVNDFEKLHVFGSRSFSIWDANGNQVFDSGDQLERITAMATPALFNSDGTTSSFDTRSDNKGPEPEAVTVAEFEGRLLAFIGMERIGGFMIYDITNPLAPVFINYSNTSPTDRGPENIVFISAADSPNGQALIVAANEVSRTTAIFQLNVIPEPATGLLGLTGLAALATRRRRANA